MPRITYHEKRFSATSTATIAEANKIISEYQAQGFDLTLRQLYYQMVARDLLKNSQRSYKRLGRIVADARLAGLIDWNAIVDRTRSVSGNAHWNSPREIIDAAVGQYRIDKWADQPCRPEVWIEKDALAGVISGVCGELDVKYFSCRGYTSASEMWKAAYWRMGNDQRHVIIHLGDHDPSGVDMTRDIVERLSLFAGRPIEVKRIALNMDQIERYGPPPNPTKITDSRADGYIDRYGYDSWELDALEPRVLADEIRKAVLELRDEDEWRIAVEVENAHRGMLERAAKNLAL